MFCWYAIVLTGLMPTLIVFLGEQSGCLDLIPSQYEPTFNIALGVSVVIVLALFRALQDCVSADGRFRTRARVFLRVSAGLSFFPLYLCVLATGGPVQSPFASHYLFLPSVVAIVFSPGWALRISAVASALGFAIGHFCLLVYLPPFLSIPEYLTCFRSSPDWVTITQTIGYRLSYFGIFALQLAVAVRLDRVTHRLLSTTTSRPL